MNLSLWVTYSGDHTAAKLAAYFATSLPFDVAHAAGNVVFCLAFGPALVRALRRYRTRFEITWLPHDPTRIALQRELDPGRPRGPRGGGRGGTAKRWSSALTGARSTSSPMRRSSSRAHCSRSASSQATPSASRCPTASTRWPRSTAPRSSARSSSRSTSR